MSCLAVHVRIGQEIERDMIVDTGAKYCSISSDILESLGIERRETKRMKFADGSTREMEIGDVELEIMGLTARHFCTTVFAPREAPLLLGALALETFSLWVDPEGTHLICAEPALLKWNWLWKDLPSCGGILERFCRWNSSMIF